MKHYVKVAFVAGALFLVACASTPRDRAIQASHVAKELVDTAAVALKEHADHKVGECKHLAGDRKNLDACLGPIVSEPDRVDAVFESARASQLALYIALTDGSDDAEVKEAITELYESLSSVSKIVKATKSNPEGSQ